MNMHIYIRKYKTIIRPYQINTWIVTTCYDSRPAGFAMAGPRSGPGRTDAGRDAVTERRAVWEALAMGEEILVRAANTITFNWQERDDQKVLEKWYLKWRGKPPEERYHGFSANFGGWETSLFRRIHTA